MGVDYLATFDDPTGVNDGETIRKELANNLNYTNNGTFLGDLQISTSTDPSQVANELEIGGKS